MHKVNFLKTSVFMEIWFVRQFWSLGMTDTQTKTCYKCTGRKQNTCMHQAVSSVFKVMSN